MKRLTLALLLAGRAAAGYCPSYTLTSSYNDAGCGVAAAPGTNPTPTQWQPIFATVAGGPSQWGTNGPAVGNIGAGCGKPQPMISVPAQFPCEVLKAIAMQESGWKQFCVPMSPPDQVGGAERTIIAFDCGYGVGQVTSGMHLGEAPSFDRARVASDPLYNLATGTQILAGKWRAANCVGDNQPTVVEDWYTAIWAYNGRSYSNNPSNPAFSSTRGVWNPQVGGTAPYQEKVLGWMEHPPTPSHWAVTAVAYPDPSTVGTTGVALTLPEPKCAGPTNCAATRSTHVSVCFAGTTDAGAPDAGKPDAGTFDAGSPDAGAPDAGASDAATPDAGARPPIVLEAPNTALGPVAHVGCDATGGGLAPLALALIAARRRTSR